MVTCGGGIKEKTTTLEGFVWRWETYINKAQRKGGVPNCASQEV